MSKYEEVCDKMKYEKPIMDVIELTIEDVVRVSGGGLSGDWSGDGWLN